MPVTETAFEQLKRDFNEAKTQAAVAVVVAKALETRVEKLETIISRVTWIIVTGIGLAFMAFVISGGLVPVAKAVAPVAKAVGIGGF
jgi:hypothetical protein